eukprot:12558767-Prorocentrum_lima.AAC.1
MTSSLVGSEMCIRDSHKRPRTLKTGGWLKAGLLGEDGLALVHISDKYTAVSYTHLTLPTICSV